jgi:hypothetical protein
MLAHLRTCPSCQRLVAAHDPTALFGLLALTPLPPALLDDLSAAVARSAGTDRPSIGVLADAAVWPRRAAAAAVFVLTLLSGYATLFERWVAPPPLSLSSRRADVEVDSGRGVSQVIDLTVGETQIVMVYNGDLNL